MSKKQETGVIEYEPKELLAAERKVHEAEHEFTESFYHVGRALNEIYAAELAPANRTRLIEAAGGNGA